MREIFTEEQLNEVWFQHDGCPAHNTRGVGTFLAEIFNNRVIANRGPVAWPARSPDFTPLDFYLWGSVKSEVYNSELPETRGILEESIREVLLSTNRNTLRRVCRSVATRCRKCVEENGRHIEQFN